MKHMRLLFLSSYIFWPILRENVLENIYGLQACADVYQHVGGEAFLHADLGKLNLFIFPGSNSTSRREILFPSNQVGLKCLYQNNIWRF